MYAEDFERRSEEAAAFWGKGFTLYGLLGDDADVDRTDIVEKIRSRYFDLVIYGSVHRCRDYLQDVLDIYPPERIVFLDGEDIVTIYPGLSSRGRYFKRENTSPDSSVMPITLSIPASKVRRGAVTKELDFSPLIPKGACSVHNLRFSEEKAYYDHYETCRYAVTWKKSGWDCLRHYEILASGAVPYFIGLEACPRRTLALFPKALCLEAMGLPGVCVPPDGEGGRIDQACFDSDRYADLRQRLQDHLVGHLTTEAMAKYVLDCAAGRRSIISRGVSKAFDCVRVVKHLARRGAGREDGVELDRTVHDRGGAAE